MTPVAEFKKSIVAFAAKSVSMRSHATSEESTKMFFVLPFLHQLGFNDRDPTEVSPEHRADFSEKYPNKVDYAVLRDGRPMIAIEVKSVGRTTRDDRGQLKRYFNASPSVKLGILTDGLIWEFFVDSLEPNIMDAQPFLVLDLRAVAAGHLTEGTLDVIVSITKDHFDPLDIAEKARKNLIYIGFRDYLAAQMINPTEEFTRHMLTACGVKHVRKPSIEQYRGLARDAFADLIRQNSIFNTEPITNAGRQAADMTASPEPRVVPAKSQSSVVSEGALRAVEQVKRLLRFHSAGEADLLAEIERIEAKPFGGKATIFYARERKGRLVDVLEISGSASFVLHDGQDPTESHSISSFGNRLIDLFRAHVVDFAAGA